MAVLVEAISVVIRKAAVAERFPGGLGGFENSAVPNSTFCQDEHLLRVGFMTPADVEAYTEQLAVYGLTYLADGTPLDMVVVDQLRGPTVACSWIRCFRVTLASGQMVAACALAGDASQELAIPAGWAFEDSLTFVPTADVEVRMKQIGDEKGLVSYIDQKTGETVYVGSPFSHAKQQEYEAIARIAQRALQLDERADQACRHGEPDGRMQVRGELRSLARLARDWCQKSKSNLGFAYYTLGLVLRILQERKPAIEAFRKSLDFSPDHLNALLEITRCLGEMRRAKEAEPYARRAAELRPDSAATLGNLAAVLLSTGRREEARQMIQRALVVAPDDAVNRQIAAALGVA